MTAPREDATSAALMQRAASSYRARLRYRPGVLFPPEIPGVKDAIDLHCHAHDGQQDALALAQLATVSEFGGLLFKTIGPIKGVYEPLRHLASLQAALQLWADGEGLQPVRTWAGYGICMDGKPPSPKALQAALEAGAAAIWMPVFNHAISFHRAGGMKIWFDKSADPQEQSPPLTWDEAKERGVYLLDDSGRLKREFDECLRIVANHDAPIFLGHASWPELDAFAETVDRLGVRAKIIDHPFSPFINLDLRKMKQLADAGFVMNFTYDEISPLLGVDPARMVEAIRTVGVENAALSSDVGEPIFPHSLEALRLLRAHMEAFGLSADEIRAVSTHTPARMMKMSLPQSAK